MVKFKILVCIVLSLSFIGLASAAEYWVAFGHGEIWNDNQVMFVEKINDQGQVIIPPTNVWQATPFDDGVPSITNGPNGQLMIMEVATINNPTLHPQKIRIARSIFTKDTLTTTSAAYIMDYNDGFNIQSSQKAANNLFVVNPAGIPFGFGFSDQGVISDSWRLIPRIKKVFTFPWGVTADGKLGFAQLADGSSTQKVYVQPLADSGLPSGLPAVGAKSPNGFGAIDISNPLPGGIRYLIDRASGIVPFIELWKINAITGKKVSKPLKLVDSSTDFIQNLAIDPDGHFFIYKEAGEASCPPGHFATGDFASENLWFQKLGPGGAPVGNRILIVGCGDVPGGPGAIDIMKAD